MPRYGNNSKAGI